MGIVLNEFCLMLFYQKCLRKSESLNGCFKKPTNRSIAASASKNPVSKETIFEFKILMLC